MFAKDQLSTYYEVGFIGSSLNYFFSHWLELYKVFMYTLFYKDVVFRAQAEYSYFSADFLAWKYSYIIRKL